MQQPETTLIYWAPSRVRFNLTLILAAAVILFGLYQLFMDARSGDDVPAEPAPQTQESSGGEGETSSPTRSGGSGAWLLIVVGLGVGGYSWLTSPRQYRVYSDALIIMYGMPRRRTIHFSDIREVVSDRGFMGDPLRVYTMNRRRVPLQVREPEEMHRYLDGALAEFRRAYPQYAPPPEETDPSQADSGVVDSTVTNGTGAATDTVSTNDAGSEPPHETPTDTEPAAPDEPAPERSPRSRRRSLRGDAPSDDGEGEDRPRIS